MEIKRIHPLAKHDRVYLLRPSCYSLGENSDEFSSRFATVCIPSFFFARTPVQCFQCHSPSLPFSSPLISTSIGYFHAIFIRGRRVGHGETRTTRSTTFEGYRKWDQCRGIAIPCKQRRCIGLRPSPRAFPLRFAPACSLVLPSPPLSLSLSSPPFVFLSLSPAHGSSSLYRLFHVPRPTAALAPSINAYVRDTMYPAVL